MNKSVYYKVVVCMMLLASVQTMQAQLLKGQLIGERRRISVSYSYNGKSAYDAVQQAPDGSFTFDIERLPVQSCDVKIMCGKQGLFGAYLEKGKTAVIRIEPDANGVLQASFQGDNQDMCRFFNVLVRELNYNDYVFPSILGHRMTNDEYNAKLEKGYASVKSTLPMIQDEERRAYCTRLAADIYKGIKGRILQMKAQEEGKALSEYPEYVALAEGVDPNDAKNIRTKLAEVWLNARLKNKLERFKDNAAYLLEYMDAVEKYITNPRVHRFFAKIVTRTCTSLYLTPNGGVNEVWVRYRTFAKDYPELIAVCEPQIKEIKH